MPGDQGDRSSTIATSGARVEVARLAYPIRDGIPVMLGEEARRLSPEEYE
jgi:hypothetical protein